MERNAFVDQWRHELGGIILDASSCRDATERALFLRTAMRRIDVILGKMHEQLKGPAPVAAAKNGGK